MAEFFLRRPTPASSEKRCKADARTNTSKSAEKKTLDALHEMFPDGTGPDCCIEAVG